MKRRFSKLLVGVSALLLTVVFVGRIGRAQDSYLIDNSHTSVIFAVSHFKLSYTYGRFNKVSGSFKWDQANPENSGFEWILEASSIDTNDVVRDEHLKGPDFFDAEQHSEIRLVSKSIVKKDDGLELSAEMTMLGVSKDITVPLRLVGMGKGPFGKERAGFFGKFTVKRSDFGMTKMLDSIGDNISITFSFEGIKQE